MAFNIISKRLVLNSITIDDAVDVWNIWSRPENEKYMSDPPESLEYVKSICKNEVNNNRNGYLMLARLKNTGQIIGTCCFGPTNRTDQWGFGYSIKKNYWNKGFASEIVEAIIEFGYNEGIRDFISECAIENMGSARVLEKNGMYKDHKSRFKQPKLNIIYESQVYRLLLD